MVFSTRQAATAPYNANAKFVLRLSPRAESGPPNLEILARRDRYLRTEIDLPTTDPAIRQLAKLCPPTHNPNSSGCNGPSNTARISTPAAASRNRTMRRSRSPRSMAHPKRRRGRWSRLPRAGFSLALVTGFIVRQGADIQPHVWAEVYQNQEWAPFDPANGYSVDLPLNYVPVRRDSDIVYSTQNVSGPIVHYSIKHNPARAAAADGRNTASAPDFKPPSAAAGNAQGDENLVALPFAALITAFLRNVIGLGTFGTFSPAVGDERHLRRIGNRLGDLLDRDYGRSHGRGSWSGSACSPCPG